MSNLVKPREYQPDTVYKHGLNTKYTGFEINNDGPYQLKVRFDFDETNLDNPDTIVKAWATQNLRTSRPTDKIMLFADTELPVSLNPAEVPPRYWLLASDTGASSTPAFQSVGLLTALTRGDNLSRLESTDETAGALIIKARPANTGFDYIQVDNTGDLAGGDGAAAPEGIWVMEAGGLKFVQPIKLGNSALPTAAAHATNKKYVDDADASTLSSAQTYADNGDTALSNYVDRRDNTILGSARTYADNGDSALADYIDSRLDTRPTDWQTSGVGPQTYINQSGAAYIQFVVSKVANWPETGTLVVLGAESNNIVHLKQILYPIFTGTRPMYRIPPGNGINDWGPWSYFDAGASSTEPYTPDIQNAVLSYGYSYPSRPSGTLPMRAWKNADTGLITLEGACFRNSAVGIPANVTQLPTDYLPRGDQSFMYSVTGYYGTGSNSGWGIIHIRSDGLIQMCGSYDIFGSAQREPHLDGISFYGR